MSNQKDALAAMLEQYEKNNAPVYERTTEKVYDLKNYFNTFIPEKLKTAQKVIRILPNENGSPFVELHVHKVKLDGDWKTFPCLKHEKDEPCPFCEAREALLSTKQESDKELAKKYSSRKMYVVKVIDREKEDEGVKFWRFNHDYTKNGVYDKFYGMIVALKKDVTHPETGRDITLSISRNQNNVPVVSGLTALDPSPLSEDEQQRNEWLSDTRTWEDVYSIRNYEYLEIIVRGGIPVWDKDEKKFVNKESLEKAENEKDELNQELTVGLESLKNSVVTQSTNVVTTTTTTDEDDDDDLPF